MRKLTETSREPTKQDAGLIKLLIIMGWSQQEIAIVLTCNIGRVAEVTSGERFADVPMMQLAEGQAHLGRRWAEHTCIMGSLVSRMLIGRAT